MFSILSSGKQKLLFSPCHTRKLIIELPRSIILFRFVVVFVVIIVWIRYIEAYIIEYVKCFIMFSFVVVLSAALNAVVFTFIYVVQVYAMTFYNCIICCKLLQISESSWLNTKRVPKISSVTWWFFPVLVYVLLGWQEREMPYQLNRYTRCCKTGRCCPAN